MANTLTNLVPDLYESLDVVSREITGYIGAVTRDSGVERAAVNEIVRSVVAPAAIVSDITPAVTPPDDGNMTIGNVEITITRSRRAPFRWTGEETLGVNNGPGAGNIRSGQITQAMRSLVNEMESDLAGLYINASRAYGTAGTTPFASDLTDSAQILKILKDNGAVGNDFSIVIDTDAGTNLRSLATLNAANEAGSDSQLRTGALLNMHGFAIRESAQVKSHTKGTASGATTDAAGYAIGATTITLASAGTGTIVSGDVATFAGDSNKYLVTTGDADVSGGGTIVLAEPGLKVAITTSATAITVGNAYTANAAFARSAIVLATRAPALPDGGDLASDRIMITDPHSGLSFEVAMYPQYRQMQYEVSAAWGYKVVKPGHMGILLG